MVSLLAEAGTIQRLDIDTEIEFKDDAYKATGVKLYLQLKSGDSYLRRDTPKGTTPSYSSFLRGLPLF
jgi:hypothetical protein